MILVSITSTHYHSIYNIDNLHITLVSIIPTHYSRICNIYTLSVSRLTGRGRSWSGARGSAFTTCRLPAELLTVCLLLMLIIVQNRVFSQQ